MMVVGNLLILIGSQFEESEYSVSTKPYIRAQLSEYYQYAQCDGMAHKSLPR